MKQAQTFETQPGLTGHCVPQREKLFHKVLKAYLIFFGVSEKPDELIWCRNMCLSFRFSNPEVIYIQMWTPKSPKHSSRCIDMYCWAVQNLQNHIHSCFS